MATMVAADHAIDHFAGVRGQQGGADAGSRVMDTLTGNATQIAELNDRFRKVSPASSCISPAVWK
jgi:hypothetical protein